MSEYLFATILAIIQGLTEFLPISSSAHLLIPSKLFGLDDLGLFFDISVHAGTLVAVIFYFRNSLLKIINSFFFLKVNSKDFRFGLNLIISTLPIVFITIFFEDLILLRNSSLYSIGVVNLIFASLLFLTFVFSKKNKTLHEITFLGALFIGLFQAFAIFPGASRSGVVITSALILGLTLKHGSKYAFILSIPTILGALVFLIKNITSFESYDLFIISLGFIISAIIAFLTIKTFLSFIDKIGMMPFIYYRIFLGILLLIL
jgi:undecaprenyl-diphosphatase